MMETAESKNPILKVDALRSYFYLRGGTLKAVDNVSFEVIPGELIGIVGESGCGKSVLAHSLMRLLKTPPAICSGRIEFDGKDLLKLSKNEMRKIRGSRISMIFQDSLVALNPVLKIGRQIAETILLHQNKTWAEAIKRSMELLEIMNIPNPEKRINQYIYQLSGGMRQRVMIAMGLSCQPDILLADEPTTALDVTTQAQILELIKEMNQQLGTAVILITHDLGIVAGYTQRVLVFYAGKIMETAPTRTIFKKPWHPYTIGLIGAVPRLTETDASELVNIPGAPPSLINLGEGCAYSSRCFKAEGICSKETPELREIERGHSVSCFFPNR